MKAHIVSASPPCPKCKSYMFMTRFIDGVYYNKCRDCGYTKRKDKRNWRKVVAHYWEGMKLWKS